MNLRAKIAVVAASVFLAGCREMPGYFASDTTLARAGGKQLQLRDVESVVPKGVTGEDSAAFMKVYVDRWVRKQLKLKEAETLFSASGDDIDKMVEEYRQALLIRKLNQLYVDRSIDTTFTDDEITAYYNAHKADFRLDRTLVTGHGNAMLIDLVGSRTLYVLIYIGALAVFAVSGYMMLLALRRLKGEDKNRAAA